MKRKLPSQQSPATRAAVFAFAAALPLLMHAKNKYDQPVLGGWLVLGLAELGLLVCVALLAKEASRGLERFDGLTFEVPWMFELAAGGLGALVLGATLYATSLIGGFDLSSGTPKATAVSPISVAAAVFFIALGAGLMLVRPVFDLTEAGTRCTLFGAGLPFVVLHTPRAALTVVAVEKPLIDNTNRILGAAIHIRGKAGPLTFSLPESAGLPRILGLNDYSKKEEVLTAWRAYLAVPRA